MATAPVKVSSVKNLFEPAMAADVKRRIRLLTPQSKGLWGKMSAAQALAHCSMSMEWALGEAKPPRMFIGRIIGRFVKPIILRDNEPMRKNSPTVKTLIIPDQRDLEAERARLCGLIDKFEAFGRDGCTTHPHSFFGHLTPDEWAILMYKHLDHHLRQFGV